MFNKTEQEAIVLNAVWDMIDGMVNYDMFVKHDKIHDTNLMFNTSAHTRLFNILLNDFLSQPQSKGNAPLPFNLPSAPQSARLADRTYLFYLRGVCDDPRLGTIADKVRDLVKLFSEWLEADTIIERVWLPSIDTELDVRVQRIVFLKICGDIAKHNFARLEANVRKVCAILKDNGCVIDEYQGYLVLPEFFDWFHRHLFIYHSSTIAEFLNNIRWAIYDYLTPEFARSFETIHPEPMYRFNYPSEVRHPLARAMYWDLMNRCRRQPYFPRFTVSSSMKELY